jgi:hypothetical protein
MSFIDEFTFQRSHEECSILTVFAAFAGQFALAGLTKNYSRAKALSMTGNPGEQGDCMNVKWLPIVRLLAPPRRGFVANYDPKPHAEARG